MSELSRRMYDEDVHGIVIGPVTAPYEFWQDNHRIARGHFADDVEAEAWIKTHMPETYKQGVEMRVFDV